MGHSQTSTASSVCRGIVYCIILQCTVVYCSILECMVNLLSQFAKFYQYYAGLHCIIYAGIYLYMLLSFTELHLASFPGPIISMRWNSATVKRMHERLKPGPFSSSSSGLGTRLSITYTGDWGLYICSDRNLEMGDKSSGYWEACFQLREPCPKFLQPMVDKVSYIRIQHPMWTCMKQLLGSCPQAPPCTTQQKLGRNCNSSQGGASEQG